MSRAAAVAYQLPDLDYDVQPQRGYTEQIRLLGFQEASNRGHLRALPTHQDTIYYSSERDHASLAAYYVPEQSPHRAGVRSSLTRSGLAAVGGVLLLIVAAVSFMNVVPARGQPLKVSGYRDYGRVTMASGEISNEASPPVIDASTGGAPVTEQAPPPAPQPNAYSLLGPPSLSVQQIEVVLRQYGSPAVGLGQKLFDLGVKYGIDPAYALAFFVHESGCGTKGVARFSKSIGNIRWTEGYDNYEGYRSYPDWESGMEDWYKLITDLYIAGWGLRTVDAIIPVYAPWGDNNHPPTYIASVKAMVDSWRGK